MSQDIVKICMIKLAELPVTYQIHQGFPLPTVYAIQYTGDSELYDIHHEVITWYLELHSKAECHISMLCDIVIIVNYISEDSLSHINGVWPSFIEFHSFW